MFRLLIQHYLAELSKLRQVSGTHCESVVREAFEDLLKGWACSSVETMNVINAVSACDRKIERAEG